MNVNADFAVTYVKKNKNLLIKKFADPSFFPSEKNPLSIFMAGAPGAGKTEFSENIVKVFARKYSKRFVHIDADRIKEWIPGYNGRNATLYHGASALGVEKLYDYSTQKGQNIIMDGTFADYEKSKKNIERSLKKRRHTEIYYLFQDPAASWAFTKRREAVTGRRIPAGAFVRSFLLSWENVDKIKREFGKAVVLNVIVKNLNTGLDKYKLNVDSVYPHVRVRYTENDLKNIVKKTSL